MNHDVHAKIEIESDARTAVRDLLQRHGRLDEQAHTLAQLLDNTSAADLRELVIKLAMAYGINAAYQRIQADAELLHRPIAFGSAITYGDVVRREW